MLFAIICCKFPKYYLMFLWWISKMLSKKCQMYSGAEHPKVALHVSEARVDKANYTQ